MDTFQTPFGQLSCYKNDQNFHFHLSKGGYWEIDLITNHLLPYWIHASVILDIGAHIGSHSFIYSYFNKNAKIYAFEPQAEIYKLLVKNMEPRPNVMTFNKCVGHLNTTTNLSKNAKCGENWDKDITYGEGPIMNLGGVSIGLDGEKVEMITVDSLNLDACSFIKMDVEGAEGLVIQGALETIKKYKPIICFEYSPHLDTAPIANLFNLDKVPDIKEQLQGLGYRTIKHLEGDNWIAFP